MKKSLMVIGLLLMVTIVGCSWLGKQANNLAPSKVDANGQVIPGTHELTDTAKDAAKQVPYGDVIVGIALLAWNGVERFRADKLKKSLTSTVQTIEKAGDDPLRATAINELKEDLSHAHDIAGVQPIIKDILAKI